MKSTNSNKKIFVGIIIFIFIAVVFGYYLMHCEKEKLQPTLPENKSTDDSATHVNPEVTRGELGAKPEINLKDGSVKIVAEFIKQHSKNPATFKFLEWSQLSPEGKYWKVKCKYEGVSSFNKEVTTTAWFYIQNNKVVYTKIISKI